MNTMGFTLLFVLIAGLAPEPLAQMQEHATTNAKPVFITQQAPGGHVDSKCAESVRDQADPTNCIKASSTATFGLLFPYPGISYQLTVGCTSR